ncbi:TylF/MycF/NovP-related O-methyltransferase [Clostridium sp. AM58-1XD]|uniref:TylF/MycF/NovP-related O-methyltransferase n=1 Tax=Clostridium sp. AM58-1XD TaxID=2292307 RepID=UPI000E50F2C4|nr:TylF/MycF/NovP-related O-methyltransferase [Clostridium sp. AM58-1XD]RGY94748.1 macrocin-O-methyltransferase [Clostridium sp. AM58-1XD]
MKKCVIFGAGGTGRKVYSLVKKEYEVLFFVDNDETKVGWKIFDKEVKSPSEIKNIDFDTIFIGSLMGMESITLQLLELGVMPTKINREYISLSIKSREKFLENFKEVLDIRGKFAAVAEAGVYQGEFAKVINRIFPNSKCYLFDTFEGFDNRDFSYEEKESLIQAEHLKKTSIELVLSKMTTPENCIIKQGYFPDTAVGLDEKYMFVNLDMDLYKPILDGLVYFYPRMISGGVILIHDYFSDVYPNVKSAVLDYEQKYLDGKKLNMLPIGDDISLAILK